MWIVVAVMVVFHVVGFLSSIDAVMSTRTAQGEVAWAVSLNTFPYVAVPAYWVLGRSRFEGYVNARQDGDHEIRHIALDARERTMHLRSNRASENQDSYTAEQIAKIPYLKGNDLELLVDGHTAWVGGHNVGDEYMGRDPEFAPWRDTHVRITGPAALAVQLSFLGDWHWATGKALEFGWAPHLPEGEGKDVLIYPTGPADRLETATLMLVNGINSAQERLWIASPYFVPDESVMNALHLAALRGVDVRIIIPDKADHTLVWLAAYSFFEEAAETGIRFFRYMDGFLHQTVEMQPGDLEKKCSWFRLGT